MLNSWTDMEWKISGDVITDTVDSEELCQRSVVLTVYKTVLTVKLRLML